MRRLYFITHADVVIDPDVPVPQWPLSEKGRARHAALRLPPLGSVWSSTEQKALDGAAILSEAQGVPRRALEALGENDRSATGFLPPEEFWEVVEQFFARPDQSIRGWKRAADAQARVVAALQTVAATAPEGDIAVVAHGGVGSLLRAHVLKARIDMSHGQPTDQVGGYLLEIGLPDWRLLRDWTEISTFDGTLA